MRILFSSTAGAGHFMPMVPFARVLRAAGHDVRVAVPRSFTAVVQASGLEAAAVGERRDEDMAAIFGRMERAGFDEANAILLRDGYGRLYPEAALSEMEAIVGSWRPDLIARETAEFASVLVALRHSIPMVEVTNVLLSVRPMFTDGALPALAALAGERGFVSPTTETIMETPVLALAPAAIDPPADGARRYREETDGQRTPLADERPLVYVSFGSEAPGAGFFPSLYQAAIDELTGHGWQILIAIGRDADPTALGRVPDDVHVESWVDQKAVLPGCAAVVFHGGYGTLIDVLAAGVPAVVIPLFSSDQRVNADRLAETGSGIALSGPAGMSEVATAVDRAMSDPRIATVASRLQDETASLTPVSASVHFIESLVLRR